MTSETVPAAAPRLPVPLPSGDGRRDARAMAGIVRLVVPDLVGVSLVRQDPDGGRPRTLATTGEDVALLEALQYLTGAVIPSRSPSAARWVLFGAGDRSATWGSLVGATGLRVGAVLGVAAEMPAGSAPGEGGCAVHVYARGVQGASQSAGENAAVSAAEEQARSVAAAVAAWAARLGAQGSVPRVSDAARRPEPEPLDRQGDTARAVARVAVRQGVDVVAARASLHDAAHRAGLPEHRLTRALAHPPRPRRG